MPTAPISESISPRANAPHASLRKTVLRLSARRQAALALAAAAALGSAATRAATVDLWTNPGGGNYEDGTNWNSGAEPTSTGVATFNLNSSAGYTVNLLAKETAAGLNVENDNVTMNLNGNALSVNPNGLSDSNAFLNVGGAAAGQNGTLTLSTGQIVTTAGVGVALQGGNGQLTLDGTQIKETISGDGGLFVGGPGTGTLIIKNGGGFSGAVDGGGFVLGFGSATLNNGSISVSGAVNIARRPTRAAY